MINCHSSIIQNNQNEINNNQETPVNSIYPNKQQISQPIKEIFHSSNKSQGLYSQIDNRNPLNQNNKIGDNEAVNPIYTNPNQVRNNQSSKISQITKNAQPLPTLFNHTAAEKSSSQYTTIINNQQLSSKTNKYINNQVPYSVNDKLLNQKYNIIQQDNQKQIELPLYLQQNESQQSQNYSVNKTTLDKQIFDRIEMTQSRLINNDLAYPNTYNGHSSSQQRNKSNMSSRYRQSLSPQKNKKNFVISSPTNKISMPQNNMIKPIQFKQFPLSEKEQYSQIEELQGLQDQQIFKKMNETQQLYKDNSDFRYSKRMHSLYSNQIQQSNVSENSQQLQQELQNQNSSQAQKKSFLNLNNNQGEGAKSYLPYQQQQQNMNQQNTGNSPKYGITKKKFSEQINGFNQNQMDQNQNQVQHIVLIAKKIEQQRRERVPIGVLGEHNYRVQTSQSNNKQGRTIYPASNLIKVPPTFQENNLGFNSTYGGGKWFQGKQEGNFNQQQPFGSYQQQLMNSFSRTHQYYRNNIQFTANKQDIPQQVQPVNEGREQVIVQQILKSSLSSNSIDGKKQMLQNQNQSPQQRQILSEQKYQQQAEDFSSPQLAQKQSILTSNRFPNQIRQSSINDLKRNQQQLIVQQSQVQQHDSNNIFASNNSQYLQQNIKEGKIQDYQAQSTNPFIGQQNTYNNELIQSNLMNNDACYKYIVNYGNNCTIVKRVIETRENWKAIETHNTAYNFRWCPVSNGVKFDRIGVEFHKELTCKYTLIKNMKPYCEANKLNLFNLTPLTFLIDLDDENCDYSIKSFSKFFFKNMPKNSSVVKKPDNVKKVINEFLKHLKPLMQYPLCDRKIKSNAYTKPRMHPSFANGENYFWFLKPTGTNRGRGIYIFNTLGQLEKYIQDYYVGMEEKPIGKKKSEQENAQPNQQNEDQIISPQNQSPQIDQISSPQTKNEQQLCQQFQYQQSVLQQLSLQKQQSLISGSLSPNLKQNEIFSPDRNVNSIQQALMFGNQQLQNQDLQKKKKSAQIPKDPICVIKCSQFVVQKYIERPMLINSRKFDIRAWVLITHTMDVYFFKESVIRTSCEKFNLNNNEINNHFVHLTNNAVQRYADNYGEFENGNQLSLASFFRYCKTNFPNDCDTDKMHQDMKDIVIHTMNSVKRKINPEDRKYTFEIYGYDFLIDEKFNVWLLEVNTNPCLDESSPHLEQVLPRMLDDAFKLTLDIIFPKTKILSKNSLHKNSTINDTTNKNINSQINQKQQTLNQKTEVNENLQGQTNLAYGNSQQDENMPYSTPNLQQSSMLEGLTETTQITNTVFAQSNIRSLQPTRLTPKETNWPVDGHPDDQSMWEFLCNIYFAKPKSAHTQKKSTF